jgi:hypothetical protein
MLMGTTKEGGPGVRITHYDWTPSEPGAADARCAAPPGSTPRYVSKVDGIILKIFWLSNMSDLNN